MVMDVLSAKLSIEFVWVLVIGMGWFFSLLLFVLLIMVFASTPALQFLKAKVGKKPLLKINFPSGFCLFKAGSNQLGNSCVVNKHGVYTLVEGSQTYDKASGVSVYEVFTESSSTIPLEYVCMVQELREKGFVLRNFEDYSRILKLKSDETFRSSERASKKDKEAQEKFDILMAELDKMELYIKPFKSYKVHELSNMFPNDMNPAFVEEYAITYETASTKKKKILNEMFIYVGVGVLVLVIAGYVAYRLMSGDTAPAQITVQIAQEALQNGTTRVINV